MQSAWRKSAIIRNRFARNWSHLLFGATAIAVMQVRGFAATPLRLIKELTTVQSPEAGGPKYRDFYGWSSAMEGEFALVGMPSTVNGSLQAAYVYRTNTMELLHVLKPIAPDGMSAESFGISAAVSGHLAVIGSRFEHVMTPEGLSYNAGAVHVFDLKTGAHLARLVAPNPNGNASFGSEVAIDGTNVLIRDFWGESVYVFDALSGQPLAHLQPSDPTVIVTGLAIDGSIAAMTGHLEDGRNAVYVFDLATNKEVRKIVPPGAVQPDPGGFTLDIDGNNAVIGSPSSSAAYVFDLTTGDQLAEFHHPAVEPGQSIPYFGSRVCIDGNLVLVGVPTDSRHGPGAGAAFLFNWETQTALAELLPSKVKSLDFFGSNLSLSGQHVFGAVVRLGPGIDRGSAYVFRIPEPQAIVLALAGALGLLICRRPAKRVSPRN